MLQNCMDFWVSGDVDYTRLYEIPPEGRSSVLSSVELKLIVDMVC